MKKLKVITVVGTRPEIIRLSQVILKLDKSKSVDHILVHTGQNYDYELNEIFFDDLGLRKPDYFLDAAKDSPSKTIGNIIINIDSILVDEKPDSLLILGDTNSCLCAIPAKKLKIPIFHMEAGNRCFDQRVPEETNRKIVDHLSDINLPYSDIAREYLLREGILPDRIVKTGSPMYEVIHSYLEKINMSNVLNEINLEKQKYFLVSCHREENINSNNFKLFVKLLNTLAITYNKKIIVSTHPRTQNKIDEMGIVFNPLIKIMKPLGFFDYVNLQKNAFIVLSDSGTISEESNILNFPALNIRDAHERPEAMEQASVMLVGMNIDRILQCISLLNDTDSKKNILVSDYAKPDVSDKVLKIILSYTDYIKRVVWSE